RPPLLRPRPARGPAPDRPVRRLPESDPEAYTRLSDELFGAPDTWEARALRGAPRGEASPAPSPVTDAGQGLDRRGGQRSAALGGRPGRKRGRGPPGAPAGPADLADSRGRLDLRALLAHRPPLAAPAPSGEAGGGAPSVRHHADRLHGQQPPPGAA